MMMKIWNEVFWKPRPARSAVPQKKLSPLMTFPIAALAAITLTMGFFAAPFYAVADRVASELMDPRGYVAAVLGERT